MTELLTIDTNGGDSPLPTIRHRYREQSSHSRLLENSGSNGSGNISQNDSQNIVISVAQAQAQAQAQSPPPSTNSVSPLKPLPSYKTRVRSISQALPPVHMTQPPSHAASHGNLNPNSNAGYDPRQRQQQQHVHQQHHRQQQSGSSDSIEDRSPPVVRYDRSRTQRSYQSQSHESSQGGQSHAASLPVISHRNNDRFPDTQTYDPRYDPRLVDRRREPGIMTLGFFCFFIVFAFL